MPSGRRKCGSVSSVPSTELTAAARKPPYFKSASDAKFSTSDSARTRRFFRSFARFWRLRSSLGLGSGPEGRKPVQPQAEKIGKQDRRGKIALHPNTVGQIKQVHRRQKDILPQPLRNDSTARPPRAQRAKSSEIFKKVTLLLDKDKKSIA